MTILRLHRPNLAGFRRVHIAAIVAAAILLAAALIAGAAWRSAGDVDVGTPPPAAVSLSADERSYYDDIAPRLREIAAQARVLADLGAQRSRDLLTVQRGQTRLGTLLDEIDEHHAAHGVPDRFRDAGLAYREGAARAREGMAEAQAGFRRFDWDRVGRATAVFETGTQALERAVEAMDRAVEAAPRPSSSARSCTESPTRGRSSNACPDTAGAVRWVS